MTNTIWTGVDELTAKTGELARLRQAYVDALEVCQKLAIDRDRLEAQLVKTRTAIVMAAIPLEALRIVEMDGDALSPEMKQAIVEATDTMRAALAASRPRGKRTE